MADAKSEVALGSASSKQSKMRTGEQGQEGGASPKAMDLESQQSGGSLAETEEEQQIDLEDETTMNMTASMKEIYENIESPLGSSSREGIPEIPDVEDVILKKAIQNIKQNFEEMKVISELRKMFDLYHSSQVHNQMLTAKLNKFLDKIDKYEARHRRDPRVITALRMAERHRNEREITFEEKKDVISELVETKLEVKHHEDTVKMKNKEIAKLHEDIKKLRDIEKNAEMFENQLMKKDNELRTLKEKFESDIDAVKAQEAQKLAEALAKAAEEKEAKLIISDRDVRKHEFDRERLAFLREMEEKNRFINRLEIERGHKQELLEVCHDKKSIQQAQMRAIDKAHKRLLHEKKHVDNDRDSWKYKCDRLKGEYRNLEEEFEASEARAKTLKQQVLSLQKANSALEFNLKEAREKLGSSSKGLNLCKTEYVGLQKEKERQDVMLTGVNQQLVSKTHECEQAYLKYNKQLEKKMEVTDLLRASETNALSLGKEITRMQEELNIQQTIQRDLLGQRDRFRSKMTVLRNHLLEAVERNQLLMCENEVHQAFANRMEQKSIETDRRLTEVVKTNIQLYCENISNEEIAALQANNFKNKEKEICALEAMNDEVNELVEKLELSGKRKAEAIEALSHDLLARNTEVQEHKAIIKTVSEENRSMQNKLKRCAEKEREHLTALEFFRRQRDLFGTKLLQARQELALVQKKMSVSEKVMSRSAIIHTNLQNDMAVLKLEIKNLRGKLKKHEQDELMIETLRQDMARLSCTLELEKAKRRALELEKEPKIHRWRALLACDPSKYELLIKLNQLTKRLIEKTTEVTEKEQIIQNKDHYFMQLRLLVIRRAAPSISRETILATDVIRRQEKEIKALKGELSVTMHDLSVRDEKLKQQQTDVFNAKKKVTEQQRINRRYQQRIQAAQLDLIFCTPGVADKQSQLDVLQIRISL